MTQPRMEFVRVMARRAAELEQQRAALAEQRKATVRSRRVMGDHDPLGRGSKYDPHVGVLLPLVAELEGNVEAAIVGSQYVYWLSRRNARRDGVRVSPGQLAEETGLGNRAVRRATALLLSRDYLQYNRESGRYTHGRAMANAHLWMTRRVVIPFYAVAVAGSAIAALVLAQICGCFRRAKDGSCRAQLRRNDELWIAKSHEELATELGLRSRQVRHAIASLRSRGMLVTMSGWWGGRKVLHLRPGADAIHEAKRAVLSQRWADEAASLIDAP